MNVVSLDEIEERQAWTVGLNSILDLGNLSTFGSQLRPDEEMA